RMELTRLHVVVQAERVADLVKDEVMERFLNQLVALQFGSAVRLQGMHAEERGVMQPVTESTEVWIEQLGFLFLLQVKCGAREDSTAADLVCEEDVLQHDVSTEYLAGARVHEAGAVATEGR